MGCCGIISIKLANLFRLGESLSQEKLNFILLSYDTKSSSHPRAYVSHEKAFMSQKLNWKINKSGEINHENYENT